MFTVPPCQEWKHWKSGYQPKCGQRQQLRSQVCFSSLKTPLPPQENMSPLEAEKLCLSCLALKLWERLSRSMRYLYSYKSSRGENHHATSELQQMLILLVKSPHMSIKTISKSSDNISVRAVRLGPTPTLKVMASELLRTADHKTASFLPGEKEFWHVNSDSDNPTSTIFSSL